jgi:hypothetical protein
LSSWNSLIYHVQLLCAYEVWNLHFFSFLPWGLMETTALFVNAVNAIHYC